jgi:hypothetical protein
MGRDDSTPVVSRQRNHAHGEQRLLQLIMAVQQ